MECHKDFERGSDVSGFFYRGSLNYPPGNQQISHLGKRNIIFKRAGWEGIC